MSAAQNEIKVIVYKDTNLKSKSPKESPLSTFKLLEKKTIRMLDKHYIVENII